MTWAHLKRRIDAFFRDESGATLVEFTITITLFLLIFFAIIDFGRLAFHISQAERTVYTAARIASVRPPVCNGVPITQAVLPPGAGNPAPRFGTLCRAGGVCASFSTTCTGSAGNPTAAEIWANSSATMPIGSTINNLQFTYASDPNLGFLGGPFTPIVTVELTGVNFTFATPIAGLAALVTGTTANPNLSSAVPFPAMSVSMPGEDLAAGNAG